MNNDHRNNLGTHRYLVKCNLRPPHERCGVGSLGFYLVNLETCEASIAINQVKTVKIGLCKY